MSTKFREPFSIVTIGMVTTVALLLVSATARAQCGGARPCFPSLCGFPGQPPCSSNLLDTYYNVASGDNLLRLINPAGTGSANVCAMIYVFDSFEEMGECCGCPLSPQKLQSFSVQNNLSASWPLTRFPHQTGVIEVVTAAPNVPVSNVPGQSNGQGCSAAQTGACNGGCDPTNVPGYAFGRGELKGYISHNVVGTIGDQGTPEVGLAQAGDVEPVTGTYLQIQCGALVGNGFSGGICSCGF